MCWCRVDVNTTGARLCTIFERTRTREGEDDVCSSREGAEKQKRTYIINASRGSLRIPASRAPNVAAILLVSPSYSVTCPNLANLSVCGGLDCSSAHHHHHLLLSAPPAEAALFVCLKPQHNYSRPPPPDCGRGARRLAWRLVTSRNVDGKFPTCSQDPVCASMPILCCDCLRKPQIILTVTVYLLFLKVLQLSKSLSVSL